MDPVPYYMDGDSGILDVCREIKNRVKGFSYVYRMTNDSSWVDRTWEELKVWSSINMLNLVSDISIPFLERGW